MGVAAESDLEDVVDEDDERAVAYIAVGWDDFVCYCWDEGGDDA